MLPNNVGRFLSLLHQAVLSNTARPRPSEAVDITIPKAIRCSSELEGDTQLALLLFAGVATTFYRIPAVEVIEYLGLEPAEFEYKVKKFSDRYGDARKHLKGYRKSALVIDVSSRGLDLRRFVTKIQLIQNFITLHAKDHGILLQRSSA
jgi:hypothetical protein